MTSMYCPKCGRQLPQSADDDDDDDSGCLCAACGWWGDTCETNSTQAARAYIVDSAEAMLDLFRNICRKEILAEAVAEQSLDIPRIRLAVQGAKNSILSLIVALAERHVPRYLTSDNGIVPWPADWGDRHYNNFAVPCDMLVGPCVCGTWHTADEEWVWSALIKHNASIE